MAKPYHAPGHTPVPEAEKTAVNVSSASEGQKGIIDDAKKKVKETFKPGKNYDAEMETKF
jgi:hypothetical protein